MQRFEAAVLQKWIGQRSEAIRQWWISLTERRANDVEVEVAREDVEVRHRAGYFAVKEKNTLSTKTERAPRCLSSHYDSNLVITSYIFRRGAGDRDCSRTRFR